ISTEGWLTPRAVIGIWPANRVGDDIRVWTDEDRAHERTTFRMLRQQQDKAGGAGRRPNFSLSDFIAPEGMADWVGGFAVTSGAETHAIAEKYKQAGNDYDAILVQALADRLAEGFAEYMHARIRREIWGYVPDEALSGEELIAEKYRGIRPAPGYPACPDHTEKPTLFSLLDPQRHAGIQLTESNAMWPAASVSGFYISHPDSAYFGIGRIGRDQVEDYAVRKGATVAEVEKWLGSNLAYDPKTNDAKTSDPKAAAKPAPASEFRQTA
ncbi:MAG TPA: vitamin B12 dependent-methionine synthase activation domain-containing protein, partial [Paracoccaceae bacterium]|nr:vitamin B12 dependent-methionine synthase activation domain-containing protein [Paracoccaceae bacterium]